MPDGLVPFWTYLPEGIFQLHLPARLTLWQANAQRRRPALSFRHENWSLGFCRHIKPYNGFRMPSKLENHWTSLFNIFFSCLPKALAQNRGSLASWAAWGMLHLESIVDKPTRRIMHHNISKEKSWHALCLCSAVEIWIGVCVEIPVTLSWQGKSPEAEALLRLRFRPLHSASCQAVQVSAIANCGKWWAVQEKLWAGLHCSTQLWRVVAKCRSPQASMVNATPEESAGNQVCRCYADILCRHEFTKGDVGTLKTHRMRHSVIGACWHFSRDLQTWQTAAVILICVCSFPRTVAQGPGLIGMNPRQRCFASISWEAFTSTPNSFAFAEAFDHLLAARKFGPHPHRSQLKAGNWEKEINFQFWKGGLEGWTNSAIVLVSATFPSFSILYFYSGSEQWLPRPELQCSEKWSTCTQSHQKRTRKSHLCLLISLRSRISVSWRNGVVWASKANFHFFCIKWFKCISSRCFLAVVMVMLLTMAWTWASSFHCFVVLESLPEKFVICAVFLDLMLCVS